MITRCTDLVHALVSAVLPPDSLAIDATLGNGNDTLFLAQRLGTSGAVIGFDIQPEALTATRTLLAQHGFFDQNSLAPQIELHCESHDVGIERLHSRNRKAHAILFNLGYLPSSDRNCTTHSTTTLRALEASLPLLAKNGILCVTAYRAHEGGNDEYAAVKSWCASLNQRIYAVAQWSALGTKKPAPEVFVVERKRDL